MKNAVVTGGTKGIGLAITRMLLQEGYGVIATYAHDACSAEKALAGLGAGGGNIRIVRCDQGRPDEVAELTSMLKREYDHIDCLVCNAGTTLRKGLEDTSNEEWEQVMQVNVNSNLYLVRDLFPIIPHDSRIVFIGSLMAVHPHGTSLAYGVTKSALHALARNLVKCFENTNTTVNAIAPGFVETEWQKDKPQEIRERICSKTAIKRFASVDEIADAVRFCVSNPFVNGSIIEVSGGYSYM